MKRDNIFELLQTNYNPEKEVRKIKNILKEQYLFCRCGKSYHSDKEEPIENYLFEDFINQYLFSDYKYKGTCLSVSEFYEYSNAYFSSFGKVSKEIIVNYLEVTENMLKLYEDNSTSLYKNKKIKYYSDHYDQVRFLMETLEKKLGIKKKIYKDKIILYVGDYKLTSALENVEEQDLAIELIKYDRENLSYTEKRKVLKQLDILVQPFTDKIIKEQQKTNKDIQYHIADDLNFIFNNFEIRHSNLNVKSKDYKVNLKSFSNVDFNEIYDTAYELILDLLIFNTYTDSLKSVVKTYKTKLLK